MGSYTSLLWSLNWWECIGELGLASLLDKAVPELPLTPDRDASLCQAPWAAPAGDLGVARAAGAQPQHPIQLPAGGTGLGSPPWGHPHIVRVLRARRCIK